MATRAFGPGHQEIPADYPDAGQPGLAEEAPLACKEVEEVVQVVEGADIARAVARLEPVAVIKG